MSMARFLLIVGFALGCRGEPPPPEPPKTSPPLGDTGTDTDTGTTWDTRCDGLFALAIAERGGVGCDEPLPAAVALTTTDAAGTPLQCEAGQTPDGCQQVFYDSPPASLGASPALTSAVATWVPPCPDGTETCPEEEQVRCIDGTRPLVYIEPAAVDSDDWVFVLGGEGGRCGGTADSDGECSAWYLDQTGGPANADSLSTLHGDDGGSPTTATPLEAQANTGLMWAGAGNPFARAHRVRFDKCASTVGNGTVVYEHPTIHGGATTTEVALSYDGDGILQAVVHGLPDLVDAERVLFVGASDSVTHFVAGIDRAAEIVATVAPDAQVRGLVDSNATPDVASENLATGQDSLPDFPCTTWFDCPTHNPDPSVRLPDDGLPSGDTYSDARYAPGGAYHQRSVTQGVRTDDSCGQTHGDPYDRHCIDFQHVLLHHVATPLFFLGDLEDQANTHDAADDPTYRLPVEARRARVFQRLFDALQHRADADDVGTVAWAPPVGVFYPAMDQPHHMLHQPNSFFDGSFEMVRCARGAGNDAGGISTGDTLTAAEAVWAWLHDDPSYPSGELLAEPTVAELTGDLNALAFWVSADGNCATPDP